MKNLKAKIIIGMGIFIASGSAKIISPTQVGNLKTPLQRKFANNNRPAYDYAPCMFKDGNISRAYWLGLNPLYNGKSFSDRYGHSGDSIMYATCRTGNNQPGQNGIARMNWSIASTPILTGSAIAGRFDRHHAGDPSVVKNGSSYYLYYGGSESGGERGTGFNRVGYARGSASSFRRQEGGRHIIDYSGYKSWGTAYGTGQPSVTKSDDGNWYMSFTTVRRTNRNSNLNAGVYAVRSSSPTFRSNVDEYTGGNTWKRLHNSRRSGSEINMGWNNRLFSGQHVMNMVYHKVEKRFIFTWRKDNNLILKFRNKAFAPTGIELRQILSRTTREGQADIWTNSQGQIIGRQDAKNTNMTVFWARCRNDLRDNNIFNYDIHARDILVDVP